MSSQWMNRRGLGGELLAEFIGTMILVLFGDGVAGAVQFFLGGQQGSASATAWLLINLGWGLAVMLGMFIARVISGAHLNPAVTLGLAVRKAFPWKKVGWYALFQTLGAWFAALLLYIVYYPGFTAFESANRISRDSLASAGENIFFTAPHALIGGVVVPIWNAAFDQALGAFVLVYVIMAINDARPTTRLAYLTPVVVGVLVLAIGMAFGVDAGYAINPARDFGPRIFAWMAGWGQVAFPGNGAGFSSYFWVPVVAPLVGGALAAVAYQTTLYPILVEKADLAAAAEAELVADERSEIVNSSQS